MIETGRFILERINCSDNKEDYVVIITGGMPERKFAGRIWQVAVCPGHSGTACGVPTGAIVKVFIVYRGLCTYSLGSDGKTVGSLVWVAVVYSDLCVADTHARSVIVYHEQGARVRTDAVVWNHRD